MSLSEEEMREMHRAIFPAAEALGKLGQTTNPAVGIARCVREVTRATEQVGATLRSISLPSPAILAQVARAARMMEEAEEAQQAALALRAAAHRARGQLAIRAASRGHGRAPRRRRSIQRRVNKGSRSRGDPPSGSSPHLRPTARGPPGRMARKGNARPLTGASEPRNTKGSLWEPFAVGP